MTVIFYSLLLPQCKQAVGSLQSLVKPSDSTLFLSLDLDSPMKRGTNSLNSCYKGDAIVGVVGHGLEWRDQSSGDDCADRDQESER